MGEVLISVCMTTYNGERYVAEQVRSILASPLVGELLVSDDGSTDRTLEILSGIDDSRLRLLEGPRRGLVRNFESVLALARGEYIFLSDQDDVWLPGKVETLLGYLKRADLVVSDCAVVDSQLTTLQPSFFAARGSGRGLWRNLLRNSYIGCCMAFRRELLAYALPFPAETPMHDWWLGLVAEMFGRTAFAPEPLTLYRRHGSNASTTAEQKSRARWFQQLRWRWRLGSSLLALKIRPHQHQNTNS